MKKLNEKLKGMIVNKELKKKDGDQQILITLGLCVVGVFLLMIFKDGSSKVVSDLTSSVGQQIQQIFTGL